MLENDELQDTNDNKINQKCCTEKLNIEQYKPKMHLTIKGYVYLSGKKITLSLKIGKFEPALVQVLNRFYHVAPSVVFISNADIIAKRELKQH